MLLYSYIENITRYLSPPSRTPSSLPTLCSEIPSPRFCASHRHQHSIYCSINPIDEMLTPDPLTASTLTLLPLPLYAFSPLPPPLYFFSLPPLLYPFPSLPPSLYSFSQSSLPSSSSVLIHKSHSHLPVTFFHYQPSTLYAFFLHTSTLTFFHFLQYIPTSYSLTSSHSTTLNTNNATYITLTTNNTTLTTTTPHSPLQHHHYTTLITLTPNNSPLITLTTNNTTINKMSPIS